MNDNNNKKNKIKVEKFNLREVIILIVITAIVSLATGYAITNRVLSDKYESKGNKTSSKLDTFISNYNYIVSNYYGEFDEQKVLDAALAGVLEALGDPYTAYIDETQVDNFNIQLEGTYQGLGVEIYKNVEDKLQVLAVFKNSPADKSGLKAGDIITKLNDEALDEITSSDFARKIRQSEENAFSLSVNRNNEELTININKEVVTLTSVTGKVINIDEQKIGYLGISIFANNTYVQVKEELDKLENNDIDSLIIDVRGNTGGHLTSVENILGLFLDSSHIVYQTENSEGIDKVYSSGKITKDYPIVILTNENSASASEILTAALKEEYGAKSVGKKTYGKGSAQELRTLPDGTQYKFTTKKWLTPKGNSIDGIGIDVDLDVDLDVDFDSNYYNEPQDSNDTQLQAAINMIKG